MSLHRAPLRALCHLCLLLLALPLGCAVDLPLPEGLACDAEHPCLEGRVCGEDGRCRAPGTASSPDGGGQPGDGGEQGPVNVAIRWEQAGHGFADQDTCSSGCGITVDRTQGHLLTARIPAESGAYAYAFPGDARLPTGPSGRLRGRLLVPASLQFDGSAAFLHLESRMGPPLLRLEVGPGGALGVTSGAGTLASSALSVPDTGARLQPGTTHLVEVAFRQGAFLRLWLDGQPVLDETLPAYSNVNGTPKELWLGLRALGAPGAGLELGFRDWKLSDAADSVLTD